VGQIDTDPDTDPDADEDRKKPEPTNGFSGRSTAAEP